MKNNKNERCCVDDLSTFGEGVGSIDGYKVFIDGALPKEEVEFNYVEKKKTYARGKLAKVIVASKDRVNPICPVFGKCGGCQIMHLSYQVQLERKRKKILDAFKKFAHMEDLPLSLPKESPSKLNYRNKIQLPVRYKDGRPTLGLFKKRSHRLVPINECFIQMQLGNEILKLLQKLLLNSRVEVFDEKTKRGELRHILIRVNKDQTQALVAFVGAKKNLSKALRELGKELFDSHKEVVGVLHNYNPSHGNAIHNFKFTSIIGENNIEDALCGLKVKLSIGSFFQVNPFQAEKLYQKAIEFADLQKETKLIDAYCGLGVLTLMAAKKVENAIGIEIVENAVRDARENAQINGIENVEFVCGDVEKNPSLMMNADVIFINPPRKGCSKEVIQALGKALPKRVVYVSCDPATLARDFSLLKQYGYRLDDIAAFDLFPQTMHVETVVKLTLDTI